MMIDHEIYIVTKSFGTFSDESHFKKSLMKGFEESPENYKAVLAMENREETGMPDLLLVDSKHCASFIEVKYAKRGIITFERTQIPWYKRHTNLNIIIIAYNDKTKNTHTINAACILANTTNTSFRLRNEEDYL